MNYLKIRNVFSITNISALKIHCSKECKDILDMLDGYQLSERGYVNMKVNSIGTSLLPLI